LRPLRPSRAAKASRGDRSVFRCGRPAGCLPPALFVIFQLSGPRSLRCGPCPAPEERVSASFAWPGLGASSAGGRPSGAPALSARLLLLLHPLFVAVPGAFPPPPEFLLPYEQGLCNLLEIVPRPILARLAQSGQWSRPLEMPGKPAEHFSQGIPRTGRARAGEPAGSSRRLSMRVGERLARARLTAILR